MSVSVRRKRRDPEYLALLDLVPPLYKVLDDIEHDVSSDGHVHIVPRHARALDRAEPVADVVRHVLEVHDARVVVVLSGEQRRERVERVHVRKRVRVRVPPTEAQVQAADAGVVVVDDDDLLVVRPEFDIVLAADVIGVPHDRDVRMERLESLLRVVRAHRHGLHDLLVHHDVDLHALLRLTLEDSVDAPFGVLGRGPPKVQLGGEPPVLAKARGQSPVASIKSYA